MHFIGITGGVGAGKSEVLTYLEKHYPVIVLRTDDLAKELMTPGHSCYDKFRAAFLHEDVFEETEGQATKEPPMDRGKLADLIYKDPEKRQLLNSIVHPAVKEEILRRVARARRDGSVAAFFVEAALLIEEGYDAVCDELWYIYADEKTRQERLRANRGYSEEKIRGIFAAQLPEKIFREKCQVILDNTRGIEDDFIEVKRAMERLMKPTEDKKNMIDVEQATQDKMQDRDFVYSLDIGTRNVVGTVGYQVEDGFKTVAMCSMEHDSRAMLDGQIHDIGRVSKIIRSVTDQLEEQLGFKLKEVCIAAAGRVLRTVTTRVEMVFDEETVVTGEDINTLDLMGVDKAQREINEDDGPYHFYCVGYSTMKYFLNGELFSSLEGHKASKIEEIIIVTFLPDDVVDGLYSAVERADLEVANMTLEPIAAMNVAIPVNYRMLNIALVDVGAGTSDICVTKDGSIIAYGMIPYAGDELTEVIVQAFLVDFATAEKIKKESTELKEITYEDIMGISHTIPVEEVWKLTDPVMEKITNDVGEKIMELNGGNPVAATFVVGGGGKVHGFCENLADKMNIMKERVALRGEEVMKNIQFPEGIEKDPLFVTPIGICLNYYEQKNNFIMIHFNDEMMKLFDNGHLKIIDAAMQAGMDTAELFPRRGKEIHFMVNGTERMLKGREGESARVLMNGHEASLNTQLIPNATITIESSTVGTEGVMRIDQLEEFTSSTVTFNVNGSFVTCPKFVEVNGSLEPADYIIQNGDDVETRNYYTLGQLAAFMDVEVDPNYQILVNNRKADMNTLIYENFSIEWTLTGFGLKDGDYVPEGIAVVEEDFEEKNIQAAREIEPPKPKLTIHVTVNGQDITMDDKEDYIFVDVFNFIDFDIHEANGRTAEVLLNGKPCGYADPIKEGDVIRVGWKEKE
ncbi:MAG: dephospho-CoA kinase [Lachnospiraceae bacterium]|nr:dephospho-CoA kinase [Lachnospiraceae bacterium]